MAKINRHDVEKAFRIGLSADEQEPVTKQLLVHLNKFDQLKVARKDAVDGFNAEMKTETDQINELRMQLERGREEVFACEECRDYGKLEIWWVRKKDGKVMEKRKMTDADQQVPLPSDSNKADDEAGA